MTKRTKPTTPTKSLIRSKGQSSPPVQGSRPKMLRISKAAVMDENEDPPLDLEPSGEAHFPSTSSTEDSVAAPSPNRFAVFDDDDDEDDDINPEKPPPKPDNHTKPDDAMSVDSYEISTNSSVTTDLEINNHNTRSTALKPRIKKNNQKKTYKNKDTDAHTNTDQDTDDASLIDEAIANNNHDGNSNTLIPAKSSFTNQAIDIHDIMHPTKFNVDETTSYDSDNLPNNHYNVPPYRDTQNSNQDDDSNSVLTPPDIFDLDYEIDDEDDIGDPDYQPPDSTPGEIDSDRLRYTKKTLHSELGQLLADGKRNLDDVTKHLQFLQPPSDPTHQRKQPPPDALAPDQTAPSYLEAAQANTIPNEQPTFTPPAIDRTRSVRYGMRATIPKHAQPLELLLKSIKRMYQLVRTSTGPVAIGPWDHADSNSTPLQRCSDFPPGNSSNKDKNFLLKYFGTWVAAKSNKGEFTVNLKIRFITHSPTKLNFPLDEIGLKLADDILAECKDPSMECSLNLYRNPSSCQAKKILCIGWLMGSVKTIREDTFTSSLREVLNIPPHIAIGVSWRIIKNIDKKQYPWGDSDDNHPPMALHIEIEEEYGPLYSPKLFNLFKKRGKGKVLGLVPRLVMCFSNPAMTSKDDKLQAAIVDIAEAQQHFINRHVVKLPTNSFIKNLDDPIASEDSSPPWTLRRFLMKQSPKGRFSQRLFVAVDRHWLGNGFEIVTVRPFFDEAQRCINNMIPECLHLFGAPAKKWFSEAGLYTFQDTVWNPDSQQIQSHDTDIEDLLEDDFFGMGQDWRRSRPSTRPDRSTPTQAASLNPHACATTAGELIRQREQATLRGDASITSLGILGNDRERDGDTVQTRRSTNMTMEPDLPTPTVRIDLSGMELEHDKNTTDFDAQSMSTMGQTTASTRKKLKTVSQQNDELIAENERAATHNDRLEAENERLQQRLEDMERAAQQRVVTSNPRKKKTTAFAMDVTPVHSPSDHESDDSAASPSGGGGE